MAIVDIQRRLVEVGRIRMGDSVEVEGRGYRRPTRLSTWKLTSRDQARLLAAAEVFGGTVEPWERKDGEWQLITDTDALPIVVLPGQNLTQFYELWGQRAQGKPNECLRRCDGVNETLTDGPCLCDPDAEKGRECKPTTRLSVLLPDVPGIGCWRLESHGYYAAVELAGTADLLETVTAGGRLVPARLRIDQRKVVRGAETKSFPVPVIDIDVRLPQALALQAGTLPAAAALEQGRPAYGALPAAGQTGVTVQDGLAAAARQAEPRATTARSAAPMGPVGDFTGAGHVPVPDDDQVDPTRPVVDAAPAEPVRGPAITEAQARKLNVQVGKLRDAGKIQTSDVFKAVARGRNTDVDELVQAVPGSRDEAGVLHWGPLRETLSKHEAAGLIERLSVLEDGGAE